MTHFPLLEGFAGFCGFLWQLMQVGYKYSHGELQQLSIEGTEESLMSHTRVTQMVWGLDSMHSL